MSTGIDYSSLENFQRKLEDMGRKGSKIENKALIEGAEIINKEIIKNAPVRKVKSKGSKNYLKVSKVTKEKGSKVVKIGVSKADNSEAFYLKFYEYGTSRGQIARPFMRPAFERKRKQAAEATKEVIRKELGL